MRNKEALYCLCLFSLFVYSCSFLSGSPDHFFNRHKGSLETVKDNMFTIEVESFNVISGDPRYPTKFPDSGSVNYFTDSGSEIDKIDAASITDSTLRSHYETLGIIAEILKEVKIYKVERNKNSLTFFSHWFKERIVYVMDWKPTDNYIGYGIIEELLQNSRPPLLKRLDGNWFIFEFPPGL